MTFADFVKELHPLIQYFGADHFPKIALERIHLKCKDLTPAQVKELMGLILDSCEYAPKVPRFVEMANIVRARHRQAPLVIVDVRPDDPEERRRTVEHVRELVAKIGQKMGCP